MLTQKKPVSFRDKVYAVVAKIKKGQVMTYGEVARMAGRPGAARAVGTAMKENPYPKHIFTAHVLFLKRSFVTVRYFLSCMERAGDMVWDCARLEQRLWVQRAINMMRY